MTVFLLLLAIVWIVGLCLTAGLLAGHFNLHESRGWDLFDMIMVLVPLALLWPFPALVLVRQKVAGK